MTKCSYCNNKITLSEDKFVLLGTYEKEETKDESYFHFDCWIEFYNKQVLAKAKNNVKSFQEKAKKLFAGLTGSGMLTNVCGIDKLKGMLSKDLGEFEGGVPTVDEMFGEYPNIKPKETLKENGKSKKEM